MTPEGPNTDQQQKDQDDLFDDFLEQEGSVFPLDLNLGSRRIVVPGITIRELFTGLLAIGLAPRLRGDNQHLWARNVVQTADALRNELQHFREHQKAKGEASPTSDG